jgi:hypothetical protein
MGGLHAVIINTLLSSSWVVRVTNTYTRPYIFLAIFTGGDIRSATNKQLPRSAAFFCASR